ncbi:MAG: AEC family transporter [Clostridia bacterium]|nr:AEC family transporter [Clostridia bacterium]
MVFQITLQQMVILFLFMAVGFMMMKKKMIPENAASVLSKLLVTAFLPAMVFKTFATNLNPDNVMGKLPLFLISAVNVTLSCLVAMLISRPLTNDRMTRNIYIYSLTVPNMGYMGYPIVGAVLGEMMLLDFMVVAVPSNLFIYTAGMYMLNPNKEFSLKKIINPPMIAMVIGIVFGLCRIPVPDVVLSAANSASNCMAPCAMLLTGFVLAKQPLGAMFVQAKSYLISVLKLIVFPLVGFAVMRLLHAPEQAVLLCTIALALPFGLNSVVFPEAFGGDSTPGARLCFIGNLMALVTIPIVFYLLSMVFGI